MNQKKFEEDIINGLNASPKYLPSKYFYDEEGDRLFREIMNLDEYYPTDAEFDVLKNHSNDISMYFSKDNVAFNLVELGAGDGLKTKLLIEKLLGNKVKFTYNPVDISKNILNILEKDIKNEYPGIKMNPIEDDYFGALHKIDELSCDKKVVLLLGGNIGNFSKDAAVTFLRRLSSCLNKKDMLLIGLDLKKDPVKILAAYNDQKGVTRDFNLNLLTRINRELDADFDINNFYHYPIYIPDKGEARSYLISKKDQVVNLFKVKERYNIKAAEAILTEISRKFDLSDIEKLAIDSGFKVVRNFFDSNNYYTNSLWQVV